MAGEYILVVEDEEDIQELVRYNLEKNGYRVACADSGEDALKAVQGKVPNLVLLDLMLPGLDGLEVCKALKRDPHAAHIPVVMLTAKGEEADIVAGLEVGADDYVTKPFSPRVLIARVRAVLRRRRTDEPDEASLLRRGDITIHPGRREVKVRGRRVDLTFTEFGILNFLARRPGWVFTRFQIVDGVRGESYPVTERAVDVQIVSLRRKLASSADRIETVRGVGYRFRE